MYKLRLLGGVLLFALVATGFAYVIGTGFLSFRYGFNGQYLDWTWIATGYFALQEQRSASLPDHQSDLGRLHYSIPSFFGEGSDGGIDHIWSCPLAKPPGTEGQQVFQRTGSRLCGR